MCGICGRTDDPAAAAVVAMNDAMVHRGPDDSGVHTDPETGISIGARRLSVIDVAGGHQPLANEDGTVWAALNGEIYNHPRLQELLRGRGHRLRTRTDTEVLVHLYEEYGDEMVHALEGMFAFAVWDSRRRRLLVARDRFGEKPLFYSRRDGHLSFASELTALRAGCPGLDELDPVSVDEYFVYGYVPGERSILAGARQLGPGCRMVWSPGEGVAIEPYWRPPRSVDAETEPVADLAIELRRLLDESVGSRLIADVPLGIFLSGGVDSTLIAALAARHSTVPIKTFTVGYDVGDVSETAAARQTAEEIGSEHHELILPLAEVAARVPAVLGAIDQPLADQALPAFQAVAEFARGEVTVAVGGEGADELFAGYPRYRWLARAARLEGVLPRPAAGLAGRALGSAVLPRRARRLSHVVGPSGEMERQLDWVGGERARLRDGLYGPRLAAHASTAELVARLDAASPPGPSPIGRLMLLDQVHWLPGDVLPKADRASMQVSLEVRTPFLHHGLAEFAATVPPRTLAGRNGKALLRALLAEMLPETALSRPKTGFRVPAADWLRGPLEPVLRDQAERGSVCAEGWIDGGALRQLLDRHLSGSEDHSDALWGVMALGLWLDRMRGRDASA